MDVSFVKRVQTSGIPRPPCCLDGMIRRDSKVRWRERGVILTGPCCHHGGHLSHPVPARGHTGRHTSPQDPDVAQAQRRANVEDVGPALSLRSCRVSPELRHHRGGDALCSGHCTRPLPHFPLLLLPCSCLQAVPAQPPNAAVDSTGYYLCLLLYVCCCSKCKYQLFCCCCCWNLCF